MLWTLICINHFETLSTISSEPRELVVYESLFDLYIWMGLDVAWMSKPFISLTWRLPYKQYVLQTTYLVLDFDFLFLSCAATFNARVCNNKSVFRCTLRTYRKTSLVSKYMMLINVKIVSKGGKRSVVNPCKGSVLQLGRNKAFV